MRRNLSPRIVAASVLFALLTSGCVTMPPPICVTPPPAREFPPAVNLPVAMRQTNWLHQGQGSCVIASLISHVRWQNDENVAQRLRRGYGGGQTANSIQLICRKERLQFEANEAGDVEFLKWASRTRRGAIIWYGRAHCMTFCGFGIKNGDTVAVVLDNNRIKTPIAVPVNDFVRNWRGFGGFALTVLGAPAPEPFYDRWYPCLESDPPSLRPSRPSRFYCVSPARGAFCSAVPTLATIATTAPPSVTATATGSSIDATVTATMTATRTTSTLTTRDPRTPDAPTASAHTGTPRPTSATLTISQRPHRITPPLRSLLGMASAA